MRLYLDTNPDHRLTPACPPTRLSAGRTACPWSGAPAGSAGITMTTGNRHPRRRFHQALRQARGRRRAHPRGEARRDLQAGGRRRAGKSSLMKASPACCPSTAARWKSSAPHRFGPRGRAGQAAHRLSAPGLGLNLYPDLSIDENIDFFGRLRLVPADVLAPSASACSSA